MQNYHRYLGELSSAHRPSTVRLWIMALISPGLLVSVLLGAFLTLDSFTSLFTQTKKDPLQRSAAPLICLGVSSLCLALFSSFLVSDFRKWSATKSVKLMIYQSGFTFESKGQIEASRWDEIKDINFRVIEIHHKHSTPTKVRVIRSMVKRDGQVIDLPETLNLIKITLRITAAHRGGHANSGVGRLA